MPHISLSDGTQLYYEDFSNGEPIIFVHGGAANHRMWEHQSHHFSSNYRVITYDARGNGRSDKPRQGYTVNQLAADLAELPKALGLEDVTVVAHGMGSHIAIRALCMAPDNYARLALVSGAPWYKGDRDGVEGGFGDEFFEWIKSGSKRSNAQLNMELIDKYYFYRDPGPASKYAALSMALDWPLFVAESLYEDLETLDHRSYLPEISCPTLILHGRHNMKNRYPGAIYLNQHITNSELVTFEESAENPQVEEVDKFNESLHEFLSRT